MKAGKFAQLGNVRRLVKPMVLAGLILVAYLAAINRAQPLVWAVAALLSATLVTGVVWPRWLVQRLAVIRTGPQRAAEGERITFRVEIRNQGRGPRFMVEVIDRLPFVDVDQVSGIRSDQSLGVIAYLPGRGRRTFDVTLVAEKRGFYTLGPAGVRSGFPLGIVESTRRGGSGTRTLTVYPEVFPVASFPLQGVQSQMHRGDCLLPKGSGTAEFSGLREYLRGDNPRHIHWPTTARLNELMVKEFEPLASARITIALDLAADSNVGRGRHATLEYAIRIAASIANHACAKGLPVRIHGLAFPGSAAEYGTGQGHFHRLLDELAVIDAGATSHYATEVEQAASGCEEGETVVVFLSEPKDRINATVDTLRQLQESGANLLIVHFDRPSFIDGARGIPKERRKVDADDIQGALLDIAGCYLSVSMGDDLSRLFDS
ncbi:MAG TPA: DUF58 domain-containing protein [Noviherbaspirillum sp.]|nr:DUF58 domain-containing protein [Noviherbaspirillum sp.]